MKPNRFFWEELEPPQWENVPALVPNFGPPDPDWLDEMDEDDNGDLICRWQDKSPLSDASGQTVYAQRRVKGYVLADPDGPRYADAPFEEASIFNGVWNR